KLSLYLQGQLNIATQSSAVFEEVCSQLALPLTDCVANLAVAAIVDMGEKVTAYPDTAALAGLLAQRAGPVVGAAGNSGLAIAQPPASWDMVLGVGACELDDNALPVAGRAAFSNAASVASTTPSDAAPYLAPGAWFSFEPQAIANGRTYWGTSFASPHVALLAAGGNWGAVGHACAPEPAN